MDFSPSPRVEALRDRLVEFMDGHVYPTEREVAAEADQVRPGVPYAPLLAELRGRARAEGLWNLFLPDPAYGPGLKNWEYGILCEQMGRTAFAPQVFNCAAPDTGNAEILAEFGTPEQRRQWLDPLLAGAIRTAFAMTEPEVAGSDPTLLRCRAVRDGDDWVIDGHKWFITGAIGASLVIVMAVSDPDAAPHLRASQILVPIDTPGLRIVRPISVMGHARGAGHCELRFEGCRVPVANTLGTPGSGFAIAQARLGPGRIHHCMRAIGAAERALELMCRRANERVMFGEPLARKQFVQDFVVTSRLEIDQARLLTLHAAWKMDTAGKKVARQEISMIKVVVPNVYMRVMDRAIQVHGALGISDDTPIASWWRHGRMLRLADGPDEVHKQVIARRELARWT